MLFFFFSFRFLQLFIQQSAIHSYFKEKLYLTNNAALPQCLYHSVLLLLSAYIQWIHKTQVTRTEPLIVAKLLQGARLSYSNMPTLLKTKYLEATRSLIDPKFQSSTIKKHHPLLNDCRICREYVPIKNKKPILFSNLVDREISVRLVVRSQLDLGKGLCANYRRTALCEVGM